MVKLITHYCALIKTMFNSWCVFCQTGKKERKSDCGEWQWSVCVANEGDCGLGTREGTRTGTDCKQTIKTQRCKIPCNWKKKFGGERRLSGLKHVSLYIFKTFYFLEKKGYVI